MGKKEFAFTVRDIDLLVDVFRYRMLTIGQLQQLYFPSLQTAYRRTRLLVNAGFLKHVQVPGIAEALYRLSPPGLRIVAERLDVSADDVQWMKSAGRVRDYYFMRHFIEINDFRISLKEACQASNVQLLGFIPDYVGEKGQAGDVSKYIRDVITDSTTGDTALSHTPDGVFALRRNGAAALFFLEIDRGTEVVGNPAKGVLKSVRFYLQNLVDRTYQRYSHDFGGTEFRGFRALYVTTTDERVKNIRTAASSLSVSTKAKQLLWITTRDQLTRDTLFGPIWQSLDNADTSSYQIVQ